MTRLASLLFLILLAGGCGDPGPGPATPTTWEPVQGLAWARVSAAQREVARRMGVPVAFENDRGMRFVFVPAGSFRRPTDDGEHEVRVAVGFYLQSEAPAPARSHREAMRLAQTMSREDPVWDYRLPTEAEWDLAWRSGHPTLQGMHDGEAEWCSDHFGAHPSWTVVDPTGPPGGEDFVVRDVPAGRAARAPADAARVRLAVPLGYGLGRYGSVRVTFMLTDPATGAAVTDPGPCDLHVIRMNDRLAARTLGVDPVWVRVPRPGSPVTLTMVPGKYYVHAQRGKAETMARGIEIKFHVWDTPVDVSVPVPEADLRRYGSGATEKPQ